MDGRNGSPDIALQEDFLGGTLGTRSAYQGSAMTHVRHHLQTRIRVEIKAFTSTLVLDFYVGKTIQDSGFEADM